MARQQSQQGRPGLSNDTSFAASDDIHQRTLMSSPRISFFISRENSMVPLIPADELPLEINLRGVPRTLNVHQTVGMRHVDYVHSTGHEFELEEDPTLQESARDHSMKCPSTQTSVSDIGDQAQRPNTRVGQPNTPHILSAAQVAPHSDKASTVSSSCSPTGLSQSKHAASSGSQTVTENGTKTLNGTTGVVREGIKAEPKRPLQSPTERLRTHPKKEYCTHWIRHGECDYVQQGCKYKHEMPKLEKLQEIGFRTIPPWFVEARGGRQPEKPKPTKKETSYRRGSWRSRHAFRGRPARNPRSDSDTEMTDRRPIGANLPKKRSPTRGRNGAGQAMVNAGTSQLTRSRSSIEREIRHEKMVEDLISFEPSPPRHESTTSDSASAFAPPTAPAQMRNNRVTASSSKHTHGLDHSEESPRLRRKENTSALGRGPSAR